MHLTVTESQVMLSVCVSTEKPFNHSRPVSSSDYLMLMFAKVCEDVCVHVFLHFFGNACPSGLIAAD